MREYDNRQPIQARVPLLAQTQRVMRYILGGFFVLAGGNHFLNPDFYVTIIPPYLPWPIGLVYVSGVCEIVLGAALFVRRLRVLAAWGLIALLIGVFPANIHMAMHSGWYPEFSPATLWARVPFQGVLLAWAYCFTRPDPGNHVS